MKGSSKQLIRAQCDSWVDTGGFVGRDIARGGCDNGQKNRGAQKR